MLYSHPPLKPGKTGKPVFLRAFIIARVMACFGEYFQKDLAPEEDSNLQHFG